MIKFIEYNNNPKNKKTCDCVVRALALATGRPYVDVYKELFEISLKTGYMLNEKRVEDKFLEQNGFVKHKQPRKSDNTKYTIKEADKICTDRIIIVRCAGHLTCIKDGAVYDLWDCRSKCISNYYTKTN